MNTRIFLAHVHSSGKIHVSCSMLEPPCCHAVQLWRIVTIYHLSSYTLRNSTNRASAKSGVNITLWDQPELLTNPPFTHTFTELSFEFPSIYWNLEWGCRDVSVSASILAHTTALLAGGKKTAPNHFPEKKRMPVKRQEITQLSRWFEPWHINVQSLEVSLHFGMRQDVRQPEWLAAQMAASFC